MYCKCLGGYVTSCTACEDKEKTETAKKLELLEIDKEVVAEYMKAYSNETSTNQNTERMV
jgi:hypothetical protein